jgi:hypothetical protein
MQSAVSSAARQWYVPGVVHVLSLLAAMVKKLLRDAFTSRLSFQVLRDHEYDSS